MRTLKAAGFQFLAFWGEEVENSYQNEKNIPNDFKLYQKAANCTKWPQNIPKDHKI
jgi:hypothetical protein